MGAFIEVARTETKPTVEPKSQTATEANLDYVIARAKKTATAAEILSIELDPTKRHILTQEEVLTIFGHIGTVLRGKFLKMRNDLPLACVSAVTTN